MRRSAPPLTWLRPHPQAHALGVYFDIVYLPISLQWSTENVLFGMALLQLCCGAANCTDLFARFATDSEQVVVSPYGQLFGFPVSKNGTNSSAEVGYSPRVHSTIDQ
jgi:hypothetical protein